MILRVSKDKSNPYVMLNKTFFNDPRLSFKAKGLLGFCLSKPDDWHFSVSHLKTVSTDGKDSIYSALDELVQFGYCERIQIKEKGRFVTLEYRIYEVPRDKSPQAENPDAEFADTENPPLLNNDCIPNNESKDICAGSADAQKSKPSPFQIKKKDPPKRERAPNVSVSDEEHAKLLEKHGAELVEAAYVRLSEWKESASPSQVKKHSNDYLRLRKWVINDVREEIIKERELKIKEDRLKNGNLSSIPGFVDKIANRKYAEEHFTDNEKYGDYRARINEFEIYFEGEGQDPKKPGVKFADPDFKNELRRKCQENGIKPRKKK